MKWIILLAAAAIAIPYTIAFIAPDRGTAVSERFLERPGGIPAEAGKAPLDHDKLRAWVTSGETKGFAQTYAWRVIPIDLLYLCALGGFLALAAHTLATTEIAPGNVLARIPVMWWLVLPALYVVTDLLEDSLIFTLLTNPASISNFLVGVLSALTATKIAAVALALAQIFVLGLGGTIRG
jgi:hypothetical protein